VSAPWVVALGPAGEDAVCLRCGETLTIAKPVAVNVWCAAANAFVDMHRSCLGKVQQKGDSE